MGKKPKIRPTEVEVRSDKIKATKIDDTAKVSFNFRRLAKKGEKFEYGDKEPNYYVKLLERLRDISAMDRKQMTFQGLLPFCDSPCRSSIRSVLVRSVRLVSLFDAILVLHSLKDYQYSIWIAQKRYST